MVDAPGNVTPSAPSDRERFEFEREKFRADQKHSWGAAFLFPASIAAIGAILALLGNIATQYYSSESNLKLKEQELQSDLIKKFLETPSAKSRTENLRFLVDSGLIPRYSAAVAGYLDKYPEGAPQTVPSSGIVGRVGDSFGGENIIDGNLISFLAGISSSIVSIEQRDGHASWIRCSGFFVERQRILTAAACVPGDIPPDSHNLDDVRVFSPLQGGYIKISSVELLAGAAPNGGAAIINLDHSVGGAVPLKLSKVPPVLDQRLILAYGRVNEEFMISVDEECRVTKIEAMEVGYRCDATLGSTGGPVLSAVTREVVGIHNYASGSARFGVRADMLVFN